MKVVMGSNEITRETTDFRLKRKQEGSDNEWMDGAMKDLRIFEIQSRWMVARDTEIRGGKKKFYRKPRYILGCSDNDDDDNKCIV
jgi:hypothetical protein